MAVAVADVTICLACKLRASSLALAKGKALEFTRVAKTKARQMEKWVKENMVRASEFLKNRLWW